MSIHSKLNTFIHVYASTWFIQVIPHFECVWSYLYEFGGMWDIIGCILYCLHLNIQTFTLMLKYINLTQPHLYVILDIVYIPFSSQSGHDTCSHTGIITCSLVDPGIIYSYNATYSNCHLFPTWSECNIVWPWHMQASSYVLEWVRDYTLFWSCHLHARHLCPCRSGTIYCIYDCHLQALSPMPELVRGYIFYSDFATYRHRRLCPCRSVVYNLFLTFATCRLRHLCPCRIGASLLLFLFSKRVTVLPLVTIVAYHSYVTWQKCLLLYKISGYWIGAARTTLCRTLNTVSSQVMGPEMQYLH
jgi:hypothetical protein